ncbi:hypothetical protein TNCV_4239791 [Trichonephila clavipes]|nr:hypothetical protein TNCV_4239791 [Trichonephila clavipes]
MTEEIHLGVETWCNKSAPLGCSTLNVIPPGDSPVNSERNGHREFMLRFCTIAGFSFLQRFSVAWIWRIVCILRARLRDLLNSRSLGVKLGVATGSDYTRSVMFQVRKLKRSNQEMLRHSRVSDIRAKSVQVMVDTIPT